jgi:hypothetical protein
MCSSPHRRPRRNRLPPVRKFHRRRSARVKVWWNPPLLNPPRKRTWWLPRQDRVTFGRLGITIGMASHGSGCQEDGRDRPVPERSGLEAIVTIAMAGGFGCVGVGGDKNG